MEWPERIRCSSSWRSKRIRGASSNDTVHTDAARGDAVIAVYNPPPGGGVSNSFLAYPAPTPLYLLVNPTTNATIAQYVSVPASINFGSQIVGTSNTINLITSSLGPGTPAYSIASFSISSGPFSTTATSCSPLSCMIPLTFAPTATGAQTAVLTVADNLPGSPHSILLTGNAVVTSAPVVTLTNINALDQTVSATVQGNAVVGGNGVPATAWIEYGTDQTLSTYTQTATWTFTGDGNVSGALTGLSPNNLYAARIAVQTAGGTGRSAIHLFSTAAAPPFVAISLAQGTSNTATVTAGETATYSLVASDGGNGYVGTASFTCTGAPAACTVTPSQVSIGPNPSPITVTVTTTAAQAAAVTHSGPLGSGLTLCFAFAAAFLAKRKRLSYLYLLLFSIALTFACASCGGGSSGSGSGGGGGGGGGTPPVISTPSGTYDLWITATVGGVPNNKYLLELIVR